jgi:hypothetical protein
MMFITEDMDAQERSQFVKDFGEEVSLMGGDDYPSFRKERLRGKDIRKLTAAKTLSKKAVKKVHSLVDFLEYRKDAYKQMK